MKKNEELERLEKMIKADDKDIRKVGFQTLIAMYQKKEEDFYMIKEYILSVPSEEERKEYLNFAQRKHIEILLQDDND